MNYKVRVAAYKGGQLIKRFESLTQCAQAIGVSPGIISKALSSSIPYWKGYKFKRLSRKRKPLTQVEIYQNGELVKTCTVKEAAEFTNVSLSAIRHAIADSEKVKKYVFKRHGEKYE